MTTYSINVRLLQTNPRKGYSVRLTSTEGDYDREEGLSPGYSDARFSDVPQGSGTVYVSRESFGGVHQDFSAYTDGQTIDVYMSDPDTGED